MEAVGRTARRAANPARRTVVAVADRTAAAVAEAEAAAAAAAVVVHAVVAADIRVARTKSSPQRSNAFQAS